MRKAVGWLMVGMVLLGGVALAGYGSGVQLPPAEEEIAAMEKAFGCVTDFFAELITELKDAVAALNAVDQELSARYRALAVQLKDAEADILQLKDVAAQVPGLMERVDGLGSRLSEATASITQLRRHVESEINRLDARVDGVSGDVEAMESRLTSDVKALEAQISSGVDDLDKRLSMLIVEISKIQEELVEMGEQLSDHEARITALEKLDLGSLQRRVLGLEQSAQALQIKIENNRHKIEGVEATLAGFSKDISAQNRAIDDLKDRLAQQDARISDVEYMVEDLDVPALREALGTAQVLGILGLLLGAGALVMVLLGN